ncbi:MAG: hypothetical protein GY754_16710 [bacterium]|nr:hypothetical protein [bacterium]
MRTKQLRPQSSFNNSIHSIDFGIRQYGLFLSDDGTEYHYSSPDIAWEESSKCFDSIAYFGYRYDYIMDELMPIEQFSFSIHGMVGRVYQTKKRTEKNDYTGAFISESESDKQKIAYGVKARIKWWWMEFEGGYFDSEFYMEAGCNFTFTFF